MLKKIIFPIFTLTVFIFLFSFNFAYAFSFTRNIGLGDKGEDVRQLQIFLNKDPSTQIAKTGPGSPGNETNVFGSLTKAALIRFQNNNGISATGFFGPTTMRKINTLISTASSIVGPTQTSSQTPNTTPAPTAPQLFPGSNPIPAPTSPSSPAPAPTQTTVNNSNNSSNSNSSNSSVAPAAGAVGATAASSVSSGSAAVPCPFPGCFGGVATSQFFCDCSGNFLITFTPLYLYPSASPLTGQLVFQPGSMSFPNYNILPTEGVIGTYAPGVQACYIYVGHGCAPIPNLGLIMPFTGASLPGGGVI